MKISFTKNQYISFTSVIVILLVWKIIAVYYNSEFIVPHPEDIFVAVLELFVDKEFLAIAGTTILRGIIGFLISGILGIVLGIWAGISSGMNAFLTPFLVIFRSTPVIAFILLFLIWFTPDTVPVIIATVTMFPFICTNIIDGIKSVDYRLVELTKVYKIGRAKIIFEVYIPAIIPFLISGASSAMGVGWRAVIIGEVLSQPKYGIGTMMHSAQIFLNVEAVIAWTLIAVLISYTFEKFIRWSERKIITWR